MPLALTVVLFLIFSITIWIGYRDIENGLPPYIAFVGAYYFVFFGLLSWFAIEYVPHLPYDREVTQQAAAFIIAFVALQIVGYRLSSRLATHSDPQTIEPSIAPLLLAAWGAAGITLLFYFLPVLKTLPSLPQARFPCWYFSLAVLSFLALQRRLSPLHCAAIAIAVAVKFWLDLRHGELTHMIFSVMILLSVTLLFRRITLSAICIIATLGVAASYGYIKYFSRSVIYNEPANIFGFENNLTSQSLIASFSSMARRSSPALLTSHVMARTPSQIPFEDRNPLLDAARNHVPRILWPNKPEEKFGNSFGRRYNIVGSDAPDNETSWNICWPVDFYITGGIRWALFSALLIGLLFGLLTTWISRMKNRALSFGLFSATVFPQFYQESNFSVMVGSILWGGAFVLVLHWSASLISKIMTRFAKY